jgi:hypothetical protein
MATPKCYQTTDLWRAAYLRSLGWKLYALQSLDSDGKRITMILEIPVGVDPDTEVNKYRNRDSKIEPILYVGEYRNLKNEIEQHRANTKQLERER